MTRPIVSAAAAIAGVLLLGAALALEVDVESPRLRVSWNRAVTDPDLVAREYQLVDARRVEPRESGAAHAFVYRVIDPRPEALAALRADSRVASVAPIDSAQPRSVVRFRWRPPGSWREALQRQDVWAFAIALAVLALSSARRRRMRRAGVVACALALLLIAWSTPLTQQIRMGDFETYTTSREGFERYIASSSSVRFEAHLSTMVLRIIDRSLGSTERAPVESFRVLGRIATGWFAAMLIVAAWAGGWSPAALRYVAVATALPSSLLYFGYRELGHLSLNPAIFPLLAAGLQGRRGRFEAASVLAGFGAALHGFGVLALAGIAMAAVSAPARAIDRMRLLARAAALGATAYLGWVFIYIVIMHLSVTPGHAASVLLRPVLRASLAEHRVNEALLSLAGARDVVIAAWIAGLPLVIAAMAAAATLRVRALPVMMFALPSTVFLLAFWPIQGLAVEADLVVAAFPGSYALAWLASRSTRTTWLALLLAAAAQVVFWRTVLGDTFVNPRVY